MESEWKVRVRLISLFPLRKGGCGGPRNRGVHINIERLGVVRPRDGRDIDERFLKALKRRPKSERPQDLLGGSVLGLQVMERGKHVVASFDEARVEPDHARKTPCCPRVLADGFASHVQERL